MNERASHYSGCSASSHSRLEELRGLEGKRRRKPRAVGRITTPRWSSIQMVRIRGGLTSALANHPGASPLSCETSSDRQARPLADERLHKRGTRMFGCQSRTGRGWSVPASSSFYTSGMLVRKTRSWC